jgi:hypothetical protein
MTLEQLTFIPIIVIALTSLLLLLNLGWRITILALVMQYIAAFWLTALNWSLGLAAIKLVVGWVASALLLTSYVESETAEEGSFSGITGVTFKTLAAALVLLLVFSIVPAVSAWLPVGIPSLQGGLILLGLGVLQLGMTTRPVRVVIGLLSMFSGFEILYSALESSVLVAGMLALFNLGLALVGVYLVATPWMEKKR